MPEFGCEEIWEGNEGDIRKRYIWKHNVKTCLRDKGLEQWSSFSGYHDKFNYLEDEGIGDAVTYYLTNISEDIMYVDIREGFLSLEFLLDVFVSRRRNEMGKRFRFIRYGKV